MPTQNRVAWPEVLRAAQGDETRSAVAASLAGCGFSADSFASQRRAREVVADALSRQEDRLEGLRGVRREQERERLAGVRRRLELELWP